MTDHIADDDLVALALQMLDPPERDRLGAHLAGCGTCRAEYRTIEDAVRDSLAAAPAIAPPAGFSGRVLAAMELAPDAPAGTAARGTPLARRRSWLVPAAALAVGLAVGAAATVGVLGPRTPSAPVPSAPVPSAPVPSAPASPTTGQPERAASPLVTRRGTTVGTAGLATVDGRRVLVVTVTGGRAGMAYECVMVGDDGSRTSGGTWTLGESYGSDDGAGAWIVSAPEGHVDRVELVAPNGNVWSTATF